MTAPAAAASLDLSGLAARRRTPLTTYRLQLHHGFGFRDAAAVADYLERLGVTDCYTSSIMKARPGSLHGYDVADHNALNPELGSGGDYERFVEALRARGLGHLLDFVPNHMGTDAAVNPWWRDVLQNGPSSEFAEYFDIDWNSEKPELRGKVLLPILGDQYGAVLERGELRLVFERGELALLYGDRRLPTDPQRAGAVLGRGREELERELAGDPVWEEFADALARLDGLPRRQQTDSDRPGERRRESERARARLEKLSETSPAVARHIHAALDFFNGKAGEPASFDALHRFLEEQPYRLAYWKTAADEINYRRFFDINDLAGLKVERDEVFDAVHRLVLELLADGKVMGLRIDHPDGLYDPGRYFDRLQSSFARAWARRGQLQGRELSAEHLKELDAWRAEEIRKDFKSAAARPLYVVCEKILSPGEALDPHWAVDGTSGYDFLAAVDRLGVDPRGASALRAVYERFVDQRVSVDTAVYEGKKLIMATAMASELNVLSGLLNRISEEDRRSRDFTRQSLRAALAEIVACFPVYRTYLTGERATDRDREAIDRAVERARRRNPAMETTIFDFIRAHLLASRDAGTPEAARGRKLRFAMKLQQYTGPVHAKGLEDTAFYRCHALISANEVGSHPAILGGTADQFHEANARRAKDWPRALLATETHDTKRGEDARARIALLSEIPEEWEAAARSWAALNRGAKTALGGEAAPEANDEYLFYQSLLGAWDFAREDERSLADLRERLQAFMLKAGREAKLRTSWIAPNAEYEKAAAEFVAKAFSNRAFLESFRSFGRRVAELGAVSSLGRLVLKIASPGAADFFQGSECWDLSLVDPDNRRPVDFGARREALAALEPLLAGGAGPGAAADLLRSWEDGRVKLFATAKALRFRRERAELFLSGSYEPLELRGSAAGRFVAFRRALGGRRVVAVAPRLIGGALWQAGLPGLRHLAADAALDPRDAEGELRDAFTGAVLPADGRLGAALEAFPFALFASR